VQFGWLVASGVSIREMADSDISEDFPPMKPDDYILLDERKDRDAAHRWHLANSIRKRKDLSIRDKIITFLRENVGRPVTSEELRYVANNKSEWGRRVRELRTELGWPIATQTTGRPDLSVGFYVLLADRQSHVHDRHIPDPLRRKVLRRDSYKCRNCGWSHEDWNASDPRHLELHHVRPHVEGGENIEENLITLCHVCHDQVHRSA
jgi:hypothetical protein